jgi:succinate dehydrogenase / fumarate reductase, cytochrome b subunit
MSENPPTPTSRTKLEERPLSPHLSIYKPQISSITSITHRLTGVAITAGLVLMVAWLWIAAYCSGSYDEFVAYSHTWWGRVLLIGWSFAFFYHLLNGVRHLAWDTGQGIDNASSARSGWLIIIGTVVVTAFIWTALLAQ